VSRLTWTVGLAVVFAGLCFGLGYLAGKEGIALDWGNDGPENDVPVDSRPEFLPTETTGSILQQLADLKFGCTRATAKDYLNECDFPLPGIR